MCFLFICGGKGCVFFILSCIDVVRVCWFVGVRLRFNHTACVLRNIMYSAHEFRGFVAFNNIFVLVSLNTFVIF
jgi:hypothetical protein